MVEYPYIFFSYCSSQRRALGCGIGMLNHLAGHGYWIGRCGERRQTPVYARLCSYLPGVYGLWGIGHLAGRGFSLARLQCDTDRVKYRRSPRPSPITSWPPCSIHSTQSIRIRYPDPDTYPYHLHLYCCAAQWPATSTPTRTCPSTCPTIWSQRVM